MVLAPKAKKHSTTVLVVPADSDTELTGTSVGVSELYFTHRELIYNRISISLLSYAYKRCHPPRHRAYLSLDTINQTDYMRSKPSPRLNYSMTRLQLRRQ